MNSASAQEDRILQCHQQKFLRKFCLGNMLLGMCVYVCVCVCVYVCLRKKEREKEIVRGTENTKAL